MSTLAHELELEEEAEYEGEYEGEYEAELEGEEESEEFFRQLASLAARAASSPTLRRLGQAAARNALRGVGGSVGMNGEGEWEAELEGEEEAEGEANPIRRVYPDALMEHLGHAASQAESEAEAEAFVGALIPLAARMIPRVAPAVLRAAPQLIRGVARVTRTLRRNPVTRPLVRAVPTIVRRTTASLARRVARGRPVTPQVAVRTLAGQTAQVLSSPRRCVRAYRRSCALDQRYHAAAGRGPQGRVRIAPASVRAVAGDGCR
ncbi:MAG TPA: hypothetical protein VGC06_29290 [Actinomycetes bacterium]